MYFFSTETYQIRRNSLKKSIKSGKILFLGNSDSPMNYQDNTFRFRQDSCFLYFFGINLPNLSAIIDIDNDIETIFGNENSIDDIIWMGQKETLKNYALKVGVNHVVPAVNLENQTQKSSIHYLPQYRADNLLKLSNLLNISIEKLAPSQTLIEAIIKLRNYKTKEEINQMEEAVNISGKMHIAAIKATKNGKKEYEIVAEILKTLHQNDGELAYPVIFSINGQTLHNHSHHNTMYNGSLALNDSGAENKMCYAGDITRTIPVSGKFNTQQKDIYNTVLAMETASISVLKPGVFYRDIHLSSNLLLLNNLKDIGILQGDVNDMLEQGVGGLFMPHGLGHAIGLDVHDMENLGEDNVGYTSEMSRSTQLGLKSLRFAKKLEAGNTITVEPGCYFIPELISKYRNESKFLEFVKYDVLEKYFSFGGIRIEDNVLITEQGYQLIGDYIPKTIEEIENLMST